jgi:hypothetical protein
MPEFASKEFNRKISPPLAEWAFITGGKIRKRIRNELRHEMNFGDLATDRGYTHAA